MPIDVGLGLADFQARKICKALALSGDSAKKGATFFKNFVKLFIDTDASLAEINPLIVTANGDVLALDCKLNFDDNALFRHPDIAAMLDEAEEDPAELRAGTDRAVATSAWTATSPAWSTAPGLAMSTMDLIKYHGGEPANFLDVGGGANKDQVLEGFRILLSRAAGQGGAGQHLRRHHEVRHDRHGARWRPTTSSISASRWSSGSKGPTSSWARSSSRRAAARSSRPTASPTRPRRSSPRPRGRRERA